jgi:hypothetical protein
MFIVIIVTSIKTSLGDKKMRTLKESVQRLMNTPDSNVKKIALFKIVCILNGMKTGAEILNNQARG